MKWHIIVGNRVQMQATYLHLLGLLEPFADELGNGFSNSLLCERAGNNSHIWKMASLTVLGWDCMIYDSNYFDKTDIYYNLMVWCISFLCRDVMSKVSLIYRILKYNTTAYHARVCDSSIDIFPESISDNVDIGISLWSCYDSFLLWLVTMQSSLVLV